MKNPFTKTCAFLLFWGLILPELWAQETNQTQASYQVGPPPDWTTSLSAEAVAPPKNLEGKEVLFTLMDQQVHVEKSETHYRMIKKVLNESGVQNESKLTFQFDPSFEQLTLHTIQVTRGTQVMDHLIPNKLKIIQQERELDYHLYDGRHSVVAFLEDIRVGDVIETSHTIRGFNPILKNKYVESVFIQWSLPVLKQRLRILSAPNREIYWKVHNLKSDPVTQEKDGLKEMTWEFQNLPVISWDGDMPIWYNPAGWIQLSEFKAWGDVQKWGLEMYQIPSTLPPEMEEQVKMWKQKSNQIEERILSALRFVQDDVRYLGIEFGPHSHQPTDPPVVFTRRFGDCKDKALLFCTLLKAMDIEAHPALVHTSYRHMIESWHPTPFAFDHVVARVKTAKGDVWLDPTRSYQRGQLKNIYFPNLKKALVLDPGTPLLTPIPPPSAGEPFLQTKETYTFTSYEAPVLYRVESRLEGTEADRLRSTIASTERSEFDKSNLNYYAHYHPNITRKGPSQVEDDQNSNVIRVVEEYEIKDLWTLSANKKQFNATFGTLALSDFIDKPKITLRKMPIGIRFPHRFSYTLEVNFPEAVNIENSSQIVESKGFHLDYQVNLTGQKLRIDYNFKTLDDHLDLPDVPHHLEQINELNKLINFPMYRPANPGENAWMGFFPNWTVAIAGLLGAGFFLLLAILTFMSLPVSKPPHTDPFTPPLLVSPKPGIGGWLVVFCIGLIHDLAQLTYHALVSASDYSFESWQTLTVPDSPSYHFLWEPTLLFSMLKHEFLILFGILTLILLFIRRRGFPVVAVTFLIVGLLLQGMDMLSSWFLPNREVSSFEMARFSLACITTPLWIVYLFVAKRVRHTFS